MSDLSAFTTIESHVCSVTILDPSGLKPLTYKTGEIETVLEGNAIQSEREVQADVQIDVVSKDSSEYQKVFKKQVTGTIERVQASGGKARVTGDSVQDDKIELLVAVTKGWRGFEMHGKEFLFNPKNARYLYEKFPFIREQIDAFVGDRGNFLKSE